MKIKEYIRCKTGIFFILEDGGFKFVTWEQLPTFTG